MWLTQKNKIIFKKKREKWFQGLNTLLRAEHLTQYISWRANTEAFSSNRPLTIFQFCACCSRTSNYWAWKASIACFLPSDLPKLQLAHLGNRKSCFPLKFQSNWQHSCQCSGEVRSSSGVVSGTFIIIDPLEASESSLVKSIKVWTHSAIFIMSVWQSLESIL